MKTYSSVVAAINAPHLQQRAEYQPGDRFGRFQGEETLLDAALSLALAGLCFLRVRRTAPV